VHAYIRGTLQRYDYAYIYIYVQTVDVYIWCKRFIKVEARRLGRSVVYDGMMRYSMCGARDDYYFCSSSLGPEQSFKRPGVFEFLHIDVPRNYCARFPDDVRGGGQRLHVPIII